MICLGRLHVGCQNSALLLAGEFSSREAARDAYTTQLAVFYRLAGVLFGIRFRPEEQTEEEATRARDEILDTMTCPGCGMRGMWIVVEETRFPSVEALLKAIPEALPQAPGEAGWSTRELHGFFRRPAAQKAALN